MTTEELLTVMERSTAYDSRISKSLRPSLLSSFIHRAGGGDLALVGVGFVVLFRCRRAGKDN